MLRVTAVVPTCGRPAMLARALRSIGAQEALPAEVIVVDDARPPTASDIREELERLGARNARLVANSHASGPSGARNCGAELATGDVLAFLDDDDEWLSGYLGKALVLFDDDATDVVLTDLLFRFDDGERPGKTAPDALRVEDFLVRNPGLIGSNLIVRRSAYLALGGFDESLLAAEDMEFGIRSSLAAVGYRALHDRLVRHHQHGEPRLCARRGDAMRSGVRRFFELHGHRMSEAQRSQFRANMRRLWGFDELGRDVD
jgi:glycosyltransferase involved in cell wall biosynthesis